MTTTALVAMMLISFIAALMPNTLNENPESADVGRAGADVLLHDVTEPRESYTDAISGVVRNAMDAGDTTNFKLVIKNDGDADLTELQVTVVVKLAGNDLLAPFIDQTDDVICDAQAGCPYANLTAGAWLENGSYTVRNSQGTSLEWTPAFAGTYSVEVTVVSTEDSVLTNNEISFEVEVVDWRDIQVDICWLDSQDGACVPAGPDDDRVQGGDSHFFRVTASTDGSVTWDARSVTVSVSFSGSYDGDQTTIDDGTGAQVMVSTLTNAQASYVIGTDSSVEIWRNITAGPASPSDYTSGGPEWANPCASNANPCNATRKVAAFQTGYSFDGVATPDTSVGSGVQAYGISAAIIGFTEMVVIDADLGNESQPIQLMIEEDTLNDDRSYNDYDSILGTFGVYHDITLMDLTVGPDKKGSGRVGVAEQWVYAEAKHTGSDPTNVYDWDMKFTVTGDDGIAMDFWADACDDPEMDMAQHMDLGDGMGAVPQSTACVEVFFLPGDYSIRAEVTFNNSQWSELTVGNNIKVSDFDSVNSPPMVELVMSEIANPPIIVGDSLTFSAQASDLETLEASDMWYTWSRSSNAGPDSEFCPEGPAMVQCQVDSTDNTWIGGHYLTVKVCDVYNACAEDKLMVSVWVELLVEVVTVDWTVNYSLVYGGMIYHNVDFTTHEAWTGQALGSLSGSYSSIVAFDLGPGLDITGNATATYMSFAPDSVAREGLTVTFTGDITKDYSIWYKGATGWTQLSGAVKTASEGGGVSLAWNQPGDLPNRLDTSFAIFEAAEDTGLPPATGVVCDGPVSLGPSGEMVVKWAYADSTLLVPGEDRIRIGLNGVEVQDLSVSENTTTLVGTHGSTYNITISISNSNGANPTICTRDNIVADGLVDPHPAVSSMAVTASVTDLSFSWTATAGDVATWKICWAGFNFENTASLSCEGTNDSTTSATLTKTTVCGQSCTGVYYFAAVPVDAVGNDGDGSAQYELDLSEAIVDPGVVDPGEGAESGGGFPKMAIYMIAGVVITAVIVGAVIVTRGGGGGEGGKDRDFDY